MDAFFFKFLIREIASEVIGTYIRKIYSPKPGVFYFQLSSKKNLFFIFGKEKALFLSDYKMNNPEQPSSEVMLLRKEVGLSKITELLEDWPNRSFCLRVKRKEKEKWVFFDFKKGIRVYDFLPIIDKKEVSWPELKSILNNDKIYTDYPHITPPLRKELNARSEEKAKELLSLLKLDANEGFFLYEHKGNFIPSVWKMTSLEGKKEVKCKIFSSVLDCAHNYGWSILTKLGDKDKSEEDIRKEVEKIKKILKKLDEDEKRLKDLIKKGEEALLIQQNLHLFDPKAKYKSVELDGKVIDLDPSLSLLENMEKMFNLAKKGRRGILKLKERRKELNIKLSKLMQGDTSNIEKNIKSINLPTKVDSSRFNGLRIQTYRTEDNFMIIRGKDKKANHLILSKLASPFDLWFHVEDGPGAHVILKRDHPNQEVPEKSMIQAASIAAYFSYQRFSNKAYVMCALVKDVRKIKGIGLGKVKVDKVMRSFVVKPGSVVLEKNSV